jgi:hypothetical protein
MKTERMTDDPDDAVVSKLTGRVTDALLGAVVIGLALYLVVTQ